MARHSLAIKVGDYPGYDMEAVEKAARRAEAREEAIFDDLCKSLTAGKFLDLVSRYAPNHDLQVIEAMTLLAEIVNGFGYLSPEDDRELYLSRVRVLGD